MPCIDLHVNYHAIARFDLYIHIHMLVPIHVQAHIHTQAHAPTYTHTLRFQVDDSAVSVCEVPVSAVVSETQSLSAYCQFHGYLTASHIVSIRYYGVCFALYLLPRSRNERNVNCCNQPKVWPWIIWIYCYIASFMQYDFSLIFSCFSFIYSRYIPLKGA